MSYAAKVMTGLAVISATEIETISLVVAGHYDEQIRFALVNARRGATRFDEPSAEELSDPMVSIGLDRIKNHHRAVIQEIFRMAERHDQQVAEAERQKLLDQMRANQKPHEMGTVAEIAAKYNISKSEVRRMKQAGTLETLLLLNAE
jgi:hypothetical protein